MRDFEMAQKLIAGLDLTSLNKDDNETAITKLCEKACTPYGKVAAVCIYSKFIPLAQKLLDGQGIKIATVINFPAGGTDFKEIAEEIKKAKAFGADEIDAVFPYKDFLSGKTDICRHFMECVTKEANGKQIKIILESGAFPHISNLKEACRLCLEYNINFLKTSTGKTQISATTDAANAILEVIRETPRNVGFKASGGIKNFEQARQYFILAQSILGEDWPAPQHFRIGASSLLDNLIQIIKKGC